MTETKMPDQAIDEIKSSIERALPSDFVRFEGEDLRFSLAGLPLHCLISIESGLPVVDAWTVGLEVAAPVPLEPGLPDDFHEVWLLAGIKGRCLVSFHSPVAEKDYWAASDLEHLLELMTEYGVPWLRRIQQLDEIRAFYDRALTGRREQPVDGCLDDSALITLLHESKNRPLLNKNLGLVCYWQKDYVSALRYLSDYKQTLFERFKTVKNPEVNEWNLSRLKLAQELVDEVSALSVVQ